jgi:hypothetical protein
VGAGEGEWRSERLGGETKGRGATSDVEPPPRARGRGVGGWVGGEGRVTFHEKRGAKGGVGRGRAGERCSQSWCQRGAVLIVLAAHGTVVQAWTGGGGGGGPRGRGGGRGGGPPPGGGGRRPPPPPPKPEPASAAASCTPRQQELSSCIAAVQWAAPQSPAGRCPHQSLVLRQRVQQAGNGHPPGSISVGRLQAGSGWMPEICLNPGRHIRIWRSRNTAGLWCCGQAGRGGGGGPGRRRAGWVVGRAVSRAAAFGVGRAAAAMAARPLLRAGQEAGARKILLCPRAWRPVEGCQLAAAAHIHGLHDVAAHSRDDLVVRYAAPLHGVPQRLRDAFEVLVLPPPLVAAGGGRRRRMGHMVAAATAEAGGRAVASGPLGRMVAQQVPSIGSWQQTQGQRHHEHSRGGGSARWVATGTRRKGVCRRCRRKSASQGCDWLAGGTGATCLT